MIPEGNNMNNVERFSGFQDCYDEHRPAAPIRAIRILQTYLGRRPELVVDLGCGTGLSTFVWEEHADRVIGIEPNEDMRGKAEEKRRARGDSRRISFMKGYSNQLELEPESVDVVTCSQSFHWMEPVSTLREVSRVLRDGGIFAAYDCDWPPTVNWAVEDEYNRLIGLADAIIEHSFPEGGRARKRNKEEHLQNIRESGRFRYVKEVVFHNLEQCSAERYVGLALSQGGVQTVFKSGSHALDEAVESFRKKVIDYFGTRSLEVLFSYRMRLGIK